MKYTPTYFDFDRLEYKGELVDIFLTLSVVYILIFSVAWVCSKFPR
jgi:hypothetical protein